MKRIFYLAIAFAIISTPVLMAQSAVMAAGSASNSPSSACLSCPGSGWNNVANVSILDGTPSDVSLMQKAFCFQSTCYYSRNLVCDQFGFSVPGTATIVGIEINITREAPSTNTVRDTTVQLLQYGSTPSSNYYSPTFWPASYANKVYGGPSDLWGLTWTPADINDPTNAVQLKAYNTSSASISGVNVDYISMTVYYTTITGIIESQTSASNSFFVSQTNENNLLFSFTNPARTEVNKLNIFDLSGRLVDTKDIGALNSGNHQEYFSVKNLHSGIYLAELVNDNKKLSKKIMVR